MTAATTFSLILSSIVASLPEYPAVQVAGTPGSAVAGRANPHPMNKH